MKNKFASLSFLGIGLIIGVAATVFGNSSKQILDNIGAIGNVNYSCALPYGYSELSEALSIASSSNSEVANTYKLRGTVTRSVDGNTYIQRVNQNNGNLDSIVLANSETYTPGNIIDIQGGKLSHTSNGIPYLNASTATISVAYSENTTGYDPLEYESLTTYLNGAFSRDPYPYSHYVRLSNVRMEFEIGSDDLAYVSDITDRSKRIFVEPINDSIKSLLDSYYQSEANLSLTGLLYKNGDNEVLRVVSTSDVRANDYLLRNPQDTTILQAFNWSISTINSNLDNIKNAGFKTIQISPLQVRTDFELGWQWINDWWKLYQPYSFSVAQSGQNALGTKAELTDLTAAAKQKGINIIVDVVSNHLAGSNYNTFNDAVSTYENDIYTNNRIHGISKSPDDSDYESIVRGHLGGYPDLDTGDVKVQERVISLLKEYIDCGVRGFRFDAAKHIETPDDTYYSSNFWSNVLNQVDTYSLSTKGYKPYRYGEVLGAGNNRQLSWYTKHMSVSDAETRKYRDGVVYNNLNQITGSYGYDIPSNTAVLWPESHDNYKEENENGGATSQFNINKAYAITASRAGAASLFLARPADNYTGMGYVGSTSYKDDAVVTGANKFHNELVGASEYIKHENGYFINVRKGNERNGVTIVKVSGSGTGSINVGVDSNFMIPDGKYVDLTSGKTVTISGGYVSADFGGDDVMILLGIFKNSISIDSGYGLKLNDRPLVAIHYDETDYEGRDQYKIISQSFKTNDLFTMYNFANGDTWVDPIDTWSFNAGGNASIVNQYVTIVNNKYKAMQDFTVDIYIKIKWQDNQIYFDLNGMTISKNEVDLNLGDTDTVTVTHYAGDSYSATSANESIATISRDGGTLTITAVAVGETTITVNDGVVIREITVRVTDPSALVTFTATDLPSWVVPDVDLFASIQKSDDSWEWVEATGNGTSMTFTAPKNIKQFLLVRCKKGTIEPNWSTKGDNLGRIYNQTNNITVTFGTTSYSVSEWRDYP